MKLINSRSGFSLIELCVCIAMIVVLTTLAYPALAKAMRSSKETKSLSNLRSIGQAIHLYAADNQGFYPMISGTNAAGTGFTNPIWCQGMLASYLPPAPGTTRSPVFVDPLIPSGRHNALSDYAANTDVLRSGVTGMSSAPTALAVASIGARSSQVIMVLAAEDGSRAVPNGEWYMGPNSIVSNPKSPWARPSDRGTGRIMAVFADGHTEGVNAVLFNSDRDLRRNYLLVNP